MGITTEPPWINKSGGVAARNGTNTHTVPFSFTSTSGSLLVVVMFGAVTHTASGWTEQLSPVNSGELSVFTKTSAGDADITAVHNGSNYAVGWIAYEFPAGSAYVSGDPASDNAETFPTITLSGAEMLVIAARGRTANSTSETGASTVWDGSMVEDLDVFDGYASGTDSGHLTVGHEINVTSTSYTPTATTTYTGTWSTPDRERVIFAINAVAPSGGTTPVTSTLDARWQVRTAVTSTLDARWQVRSAVTSTADLRWAVLSNSPLTSTISDNFDDNVIDTGLWSANYGTGVSETGSRARLVCDTGYKAFNTGSIYSFDSVMVAVYPPALNGGTANVSTGIKVASAAQPGGTDVTMFLDVVANQVNCATRTGYFDGGAVQFTYNSTTHRWWRIRISGTDLLYDTSSDGLAWTNRRTVAAPAYLLSAADIAFAMETHRDDGSANDAEFDNFNLPPIPAPVTGSVDIRWAVSQSVTSTFDARWQVRGAVTATLDARWAVRNQITALLDVRWTVRQRPTATLDLRWLVDGEVFIPKSNVRSYLSERVRARPTIAQIRPYP